MNSLEIEKLLEKVSNPISAIEKQIGIPATVLQKSLKGKRSLPKKWSILLKDYVERKMYLVGSKNVVQDLTEPTNQVKDFSKPPPKTNYSVDTRKPFMSDAIKKKLGIK